MEYLFLFLAGTEGGVGEVVCDTFEAIFAACAAAEHPISYAYRYETNCSKYNIMPHCMSEWVIIFYYSTPAYIVILCPMKHIKVKYRNMKSACF